ncbi:MAG: hypothetical protein ACKOOG_12245, partial [Actinomycetota bacterium]
ALAARVEFGSEVTVVTDPAVVAARAADSKKAEEILVLDGGEHDEEQGNPVSSAQGTGVATRSPGAAHQV